MVRGSPSSPLLQALREEHSFLIGGYPPLHPLATRGKRTLLCGGSPPPPSIYWLRAGGARCLVEMPPSIPWL